MSRLLLAQKSRHFLLLLMSDVIPKKRNQMESYLLYIAIASATIASPGPGVVLTISNSIRYGFFGSVAGIVGVASAMLCIATISATSLAVILSTSALAFTILKYVGAAILFI